MIRLIAAIDKRRGLADQHGIPWQGKIPTDTAYFREHTTDGLILMGYRTYEEFDQPLHDRLNFVASRSKSEGLRPGFVGIPDLLQFLREHTHDLVWVLGGAAVFTASKPIADELYITQLDGDFHCTKFFPPYEDDFLLVANLGNHLENGISFRFQTWQRSATPPNSLH
jgi:dihydrofolate reductase